MLTMSATVATLMPSTNKEDTMPQLSNEEIKSLARSAGLNLEDPELTDVAYSLNAIVEAIDEIDVPGLNYVEPLPIILPRREE